MGASPSSISNEEMQDILNNLALKVCAQQEEQVISISSEQKIKLPGSLERTKKNNNSGKKHICFYGLSFDI